MIFDMTKRKGGVEEVYCTKFGRVYVKNMELITTVDNMDPGMLNGTYQNADELETVYMHGTPWTSTVGLQNTFNTCGKLKHATIEQVRRYSNYVFIRCPMLETAQLGCVGNGVLALYNTFYGLTQQNLTITIFVDDETAIPLANSPWGATNATIVYRSSTTGEVRTV